MTFHCSAIGNPVPRITWIKDGKTVGSEETLRFTALRNDSGMYLCSVDNGMNVTVKARTYLNVQCKFKHASLDYKKSLISLLNVAGNARMKLEDRVE